jgi:hypothetical protein
VACIEPVFVGCSYREMQAGLGQQLSGLTPSRRNTIPVHFNNIGSYFLIPLIEGGEPLSELLLINAYVERDDLTTKASWKTLTFFHGSHTASPVHANSSSAIEVSFPNLCH